MTSVAAHCEQSSRAPTLVSDRRRPLARLHPHAITACHTRQHDGIARPRLARSFAGCHFPSPGAAVRPIAPPRRGLATQKGP